MREGDVGCGHAKETRGNKLAYFSCFLNAAPKLYGIRTHHQLMDVLMAHYRELQGQRATGRHGGSARKQCGEARARRRCAVARALMPRCMVSDRCLELHVVCRACGQACCGRGGRGHRGLADREMTAMMILTTVGSGPPRHLSPQRQVCKSLCTNEL